MADTTEGPAKQGPGEGLGALDTPESVAGVPGPGRWLAAEYMPASLFSLKLSMATSSVGKSLLVPTPYAIKMALVDAAFRAGLTDTECAAFLRDLVATDVRIGPPQAAVVTHTFVKVRQEPHGGSRPDEPYISSIAFRDVVHHEGVWRWAFDLSSGRDSLAERLVRVAPHVAYIGKRGSFVQFSGFCRMVSLDDSFTRVPESGEPWPIAGHVAPLDDFGPEATLEVLSSFSSRPARRDRHRKFVHTVIPLAPTNTGPGFTQYSR